MTDDLRRLGEMLVSLQEEKNRLWKNIDENEFSEFSNVHLDYQKNGKYLVVTYIHRGEKNRLYIGSDIDKWRYYEKMRYESEKVTEWKNRILLITQHQEDAELESFMTLLRLRTFCRVQKIER